MCIRDRPGRTLNQGVMNWCQAVSERGVEFDVTELYSPPRVTAMAETLKMVPGLACDLTTVDTDGQAWDFDQAHMRSRALRLVTQRKAYLLVGSPMCSAFSALQALNKNRSSPQAQQERYAYGKRHLEFMAKLYKIQYEQGLYCLLYTSPSPRDLSTSRMPSSA